MPQPFRAATPVTDLANRDGPLAAVPVGVAAVVPVGVAGGVLVGVSTGVLVGVPTDQARNVAHDRLVLDRGGRIGGPE